MRVYSLSAGRTCASQAASIAALLAGAVRASRLRDLRQPLERRGHRGRRLFADPAVLQENPCLSRVMSQVSVTLVPSSTGSSS